MQLTSGVIERHLSGERPYFPTTLEAQLGGVDVVHVEPPEAKMIPVRAMGWKPGPSLLPALRETGKEQ
jgi:hypothetical protein